MARKPVTLIASPISMQLLATIAAATASDNGNGFTYVSESDAKPLTEALLIEVNPAMKDANGNIAARTTEKGTAMASHGTTQTIGTKDVASLASVLGATASKYEIDDYVPDMAIKGRGRGSSGSGLQVDIDKLEVLKGSIHIAATEAMPEPAKSVASSISVANMRWSKGTGVMENVTVNVYQVDDKGKRVKGADGSYIKTGEKTEPREKRESIREFRVRSVDGTDPKGTGARIVRVK